MGIVSSRLVRLWKNITTRVPTTTKSDLLETVKQLEGISARASTMDDLFEAHVKNVRDSLVTWFIDLVSIEMQSEEALVFTSKQEDWLSLTAKFFDAYVKYLKAIYASDPRALLQRAVFLSHSGAEKPSYVLPFRDHLLSNNSPYKVFVDVSSIEPAANGEEEILIAAVTYPVFWCVLTPSFLKRKWTVIEYLIGWSRHANRDDDQFGLVLDCLEPGNIKATGLWKDKILNMKCLRVGRSLSLPQFHGYEKVMESYVERFKRLAATELANGACLVENTFEREDQSPSSQRRQLKPVTHVHATFPLDTFKRKLLNASHIRIMNTWIHHLENFIAELRFALQSGARIEILLVDPKSKFAEARNEAIGKCGFPSEYSVPLSDPIREGVHRNITWLREMKQQIVMSSAQCTGSLEVKLYNSLASCTAYQADTTVFVGILFHGRVAFSEPQFEAQLSETILGRQIDDEFKILWDNGVLVDLESAVLRSGWTRWVDNWLQSDRKK